MQKIKKKCLRALARFNRSGLARKGMLAIAAVTVAAGDAMAASKGAAGFTKATLEAHSVRGGSSQMYLEQCIAFPFTYFLSKWRMSFLNRVLIEKNHKT